MLAPLDNVSAARVAVNTPGTPEFEAYRKLGGIVGGAAAAPVATPAVVKGITFQDATTSAKDGTAYVPASDAEVVTFSIRGTSSSRTVVFEISDDGSSFLPHTAFSVNDPTKYGTQTTGGNNATPELWQAIVPKGFFFRARVAAVSGGNVTIKGGSSTAKGGLSVIGASSGGSVTPIAPAAPTGLATSVSGGQMVVTWSASSGATGYTLKRGTTAGGPYNTSVYTGASLTYTDTSAVAGTTYYYVVTASNSAGESAASSQASGIVSLPVPSAPTGLAVVTSSGQAVASWSAASGATSYKLKRGTAAGGPYTTIYTGPNLTYTDVNAVAGTAYYYIVTASNASGESANSTEVSATVAVPVPAAPTGVAAATGTGQMVLSWIAVSGATSYKVKRGTAAGGPYGSTVYTGSNTTYTDTTAVIGTSYYYVVTASNASGEGTNSSEVNGTLELMPAQNYGSNMSVIASFVTKVKTAGSQPRILMLGDSITRGLTSSDETQMSWAEQLRKLMQAKYGNAGVGFIAAREGSESVGTPGTASGVYQATKRTEPVSRSTGSYYAAPLFTGGFAGEYVKLGGGYDVRFRGINCNKFTLLYVDRNAGNGGKASVWVDGTAIATNVGDNTVTEDTARSVTYTVTAGMHDIYVGCTSGNFNVVGITAESATSGILTYRTGRESWKAFDWNRNPMTAGADAGKSIIHVHWAQQQIDLAIIALGTNDYKADSTATFKTNMTTIINDLKAQGAAVILYAMHQAGDSWIANASTLWPTYVTAMQELATDLGCGFINGYTAWGSSYTWGQNNGLYGINPSDFTGGAGTDPVHPSDKGHRYIAQTIFKSIDAAITA
ncbi:GDSL-type esterase/lipase family protein [Cohnella sp. OV330]|uniref:GDSL-type esterase/lipase family protein n=1 Tax=Cohnella sp. OV330 TaxID=1855288 RepID=UPI001314E6D7|nr:GDSL-type esterase/lipase family protein [Cohnella sp. OV330]